MLYFDQIRLNGKIYTAANIETFEQVEDWQKMIVDFLTNWFDASLRVEVDTSGSTGAPKKIRLPKQSMINSALATNNYFSLTKKTNALLCLPASHIAGKMMLVRAIVGQYNLICVKPSKRPFEKTTEQLNFAALTPYQLSYSLSDIDKKQPDKIIVGGAGIPSAIIESVQNLRSNIYETYGMTETCSHIAIRTVNGNNKSDYFHTLDNVYLRTNSEGCLCINAPHLHNTEIITNDIVDLKDENSFQIIGRLDNVINTGGIKVHPEKIEKKLEKIIDKPFFISSLPDENLGNKVILIIEGKPDEQKSADMLLNQISKVLARYEKPRLLLYTPAFIYSPNNKLLKAETLRAALNQNIN